MVTSQISYRVIYGDTDQLGVVYYANYLRWFEMGRTEYMRNVGMSYKQVEKDGYFFPVTEVCCRYRQPARFDDRLLIETSIGVLGPASLRFNYTIYRDGEPNQLTDGWTKHACTTRGGRPTPLPRDYSIKLTGKHNT